MIADKVLKILLLNQNNSDLTRSAENRKLKRK